VTYVVMY